MKVKFGDDLARRFVVFAILLVTILGLAKVFDVIVHNAIQQPTLLNNGFVVLSMFLQASCSLCILVWMSFHTNFKLIQYFEQPLFAYLVWFVYKIAEQIIASPDDSATTAIYGVATLVLFGSVIYYLHILARHLKDFENPTRVPLALALISYGVTVVPFVVLLILASLLPEYPVLLSGLLFTAPLIILTGSFFISLHARNKRRGIASDSHQKTTIVYSD